MKCRPGDLAVVIGGGVPENYGLIVEVISAVGPVEFYGEIILDWWNVRCAGPVYDRALGRDVPGDIGHLCRDINLQPIRGVDRTETTQREKELQC